MHRCHAASIGMLICAVVPCVFTSAFIVFSFAHTIQSIRMTNQRVCVIGACVCLCADKILCLRFDDVLYVSAHLKFNEWEREPPCCVSHAFSIYSKVSCHILTFAKPYDSAVQHTHTNLDRARQQQCCWRMSCWFGEHAFVWDKHAWNFVQYSRNTTIVADRRATLP